MPTTLLIFNLRALRSCSNAIWRLHSSPVTRSRHDPRPLIPLACVVLAVAIECPAVPAQPPGENPTVEATPALQARPGSSGPPKSPKESPVTPKLNTAIGEPRDISRRIEAWWQEIQRQFTVMEGEQRTTEVALRDRITELEKALGVHSDEAERLQRENVELASKLKQLEQEPGNQPFPGWGNPWLQGSGLIGLLAGMTAGLLLSMVAAPRRARAGTRSIRLRPSAEERFMKRRDLPLRSPMGDWPELSRLANETWQSVRIRSPWRDTWTEQARRAMADTWEHGTQPAGRAAAAEFAAATWARFVSQFDPDPDSWTWTKTTCAAALPPGLHLDLGGIRVNEPYRDHAGSVTQASGEGQYIAAVQFPGCTTRDENGTLLHEVGAIVVKGDRI